MPKFPPLVLKLLNITLRRDKADTGVQRGERPASNNAVVSRARHQALPVPQGHHSRRRSSATQGFRLFFLSDFF